MSNDASSKTSSSDRPAGPGSRAERPGVPMDLQKRTLKVFNYNNMVTRDLLRELFNQVGPVRNVVFKPDFSFVEFEDEESVGYSLAMFDNLTLFGKTLQMQPKINSPEFYNYLEQLKCYENTFSCNPSNWWAKFGDPSKPVPKHICSYTAGLQQQHWQHQQKSGSYPQLPSSFHTPSTGTFYLPPAPPYGTSRPDAPHHVSTPNLYASNPQLPIAQISNYDIDYRVRSGYQSSHSYQPYGGGSGIGSSGYYMNSAHYPPATSAYQHSSYEQSYEGTHQRDSMQYQQHHGRNGRRYSDSRRSSGGGRLSY